MRLRKISIAILPFALGATLLAEPAHQDQHQTQPTEKQLKHEEHASKEQAKSAKHQRSALKSQAKAEKAKDKADKEAAKANAVSPSTPDPQ